MNRNLMFWLAVLLLFLGGTSLWAGYALWKKGGFGGRAGSSGDPLAGADANRKLTEFEFWERSGRKFRSEELEGEVWVANFFFTTCPSICLQENQVFARLAREFGPKGVKFVSISVDPNDTPSVLSEYADRLGADEEDWLFLTGDYAYTKRVAEDIFQVPLEFERGIHAEEFITVDRQGRLKRSNGWNDEEGLEDLRLLLDQLLAQSAETEPAPAEENAPAEEETASRG